MYYQLFISDVTCCSLSLTISCPLCGHTSILPPEGVSPESPTTNTNISWVFYINSWTSSRNVEVESLKKSSLLICCHNTAVLCWKDNQVNVIKFSADKRWRMSGMANKVLFVTVEIEQNVKFKSSLVLLLFSERAWLFNGELQVLLIGKYKWISTSTWCWQFPRVNFWNLATLVSLKFGKTI